MKKVVLYSPYIPKHFGGGERYLLSIAEVASLSAQTSLLVSPEKLEETKKSLSKYQNMFGLDLSRVEVEPTVIGTGKKTLATFFETKKYDVLFAMTDGSVFPSLAAKSYLITQVPWTRSLSIAERLKLLTWKKILVYSQFVQRILQSSWKLSNIEVLSPYVDTRDFYPSVEKKEKIILSIGRFFSHNTSNSKRQDVLIDAYKELVDTHHLKGWTLVLLGTVEDQAFLESLKKQAKGYHVAFATNTTYDEVKSFCARASIYWHAAGFAVDERTHPENTEHFGITTLEAMASGCIPLVVPKGGQQEVVGDERFFWNTTKDLVEKTYQFICADTTAQVAVRGAVAAQAEKYSKARFEQAIGALL